MAMGWLPAGGLLAVLAQPLLRAAALAMLAALPLALVFGWAGCGWLAESYPRQRRDRRQKLTASLSAGKQAEGKAAEVKQHRQHLQRVLAMTGIAAWVHAVRIILAAGTSRLSDPGVLSNATATASTANDVITGLIASEGYGFIESVIGRRSDIDDRRAGLNKQRAALGSGVHLSAAPGEHSQQLLASSGGAPAVVTEAAAADPSALLGQQAARLLQEHFGPEPYPYIVARVDKHEHFLWVSQPAGAGEDGVHALLGRDSQVLLLQRRVCCTRLPWRSHCPLP